MDTRKILKDFGLRTTKSLGQHFLKDANIAADIAAQSRAGEATLAVEIGPGLGILTRELAAISKNVVALELDKRLAPALSETLKDCPNAEVRFADALKADFAGIAADFPGLTPVLCANLPYNLTTPLLTRILSCGQFTRVAVMVQREVARRIAGNAGTPDYGAFSVFCQNRADISIAFDVSPESFAPPPKVWSAVVTFDVFARPLCTHPQFERVVRAAFGQRRKQLINALPAGLGITREAAVAAMDSEGVAPTARGETLNLETFAKLTERLFPLS